MATVAASALTTSLSFPVLECSDEEAKRAVAWLIDSGYWFEGSQKDGVWRIISNVPANELKKAAKATSRLRRLK